MNEGCRILIVDDEIDGAESVRDALEMAGHSVVSVNSGFAAMDELAKNQYDVVLLDIRMPVMDGVETFDRVKGTCNENDTTVIMMTAYSLDRTVHRALANGIYTVLDKPLDISALDQELRQVRARPLVTLIDDDPSIRAALEVMIRGAGFRVRGFESGSHAVHWIKSRIAEIIILDLQMPGMDGIETLRAIRAANPESKVVILTSHAGKFFDRLTAFEPGEITGCFDKPFNPSALIQHLNVIAGKPSKASVG